MTSSNEKSEQLIKKIQALPPDTAADVEELINCLFARAVAESRKCQKIPASFPVDDAGPWPEGLRLDRAFMYGDDQR